MAPDPIDAPRRQRRNSALPTDAALRRIMADEPDTTVRDLAEYYEVTEATVRKVLARLGMKAKSPPAPRKLPEDDLLRPMLVEAEFTGFAPIMAAYQVTGACLSKAKKRLGVVWQSQKRAESRAKTLGRRRASPPPAPSIARVQPVQLCLEFV